MRSLLQSKNLKVRIQAAEGLRVPSSREVFGDGIEGLLEAAESARELLETEEVPPKEIVHRDQLVEKVRPILLLLVSADYATAETSSRASGVALVRDTVYFCDELHWGGLTWHCTGIKSTFLTLHNAASTVSTVSKGKRTQGERRTNQSPSGQNSPSVHLIRIEARRAVRQRCKEVERPQQCHDDDHNRGDHAPVHLCHRAHSTSRRQSRNRDGIVDRFGGDKVEHSPRDESGAEMGGEVVMQEKLTGHGEKGEVVEDPREEEKSTRVVQSVARRCGLHISR